MAPPLPTLRNAPAASKRSKPWFAPLRRWEDVFDKAVAVPYPHDAVVMAAMRAAVLAPEDDLGNWFSWPIPPETVEGLVAEGRLVHPAPGWLAVAD